MRKVILAVLCGLVAGLVWAEGWSAPVSKTTEGGLCVWTNQFLPVSLGQILSTGGSGAALTTTVSVVSGSATAYVGTASAVYGTARFSIDPGTVRVYTGCQVRVSCNVTSPVTHVFHNNAGE
jgi:hypothetical protein